MPSHVPTAADTLPTVATSQPATRRLSDRPAGVAASALSPSAAEFVGRLRADGRAAQLLLDRTVRALDVLDDDGRAALLAALRLAEAPKDDASWEQAPAIARAVPVGLEPVTLFALTGRFTLEPAGGRPTPPDAQVSPAVVPKVAGAPEPTVGDDTVEVGALVGEALRRGRYDAAAWLARGAPLAVDVRVALRTLAFTAALRSDQGELAGAGAAELAAVDLEAVTDATARRVLVGAAVIGGLVAPFACLDLLDWAAKRTVDMPATGRVVDHLREAARLGLHLGAFGFDRRRHAADGAVAEAAERAAELLELGPARTVKFHAATEVWQAWFDDGSEMSVLAAILGPVAAGDRASASRVAELVGRMSTVGDIDEIIDVTSREVRGHRAVGNPIIAGARTTLRRWAEEHAAVAREWLAALEDLPDEVPYQQRVADALVETVMTCRDDLVRELDPETAGELDHAAAAALRDEFDALFDLVVSGEPLEGREAPPRAVLGALLARCWQVPVAARGGRLDVDVANFSLDQARQFLDPPSWVEAFDRRRERDSDMVVSTLVELAGDCGVEAADTLLARWVGQAAV